MSVTETEQAVIDRTKLCTRRLGWWTDKNGRRLLHPGDRLTLVRKSMGRRRADGTLEPLVRLAEVEVTDVYRERLLAITEADIALEGVDPAKPALARQYAAFPGDPRRAWAVWFARTMGCRLSDDVTVIRWRYVEPAGEPSCEDWCLARCQGPCQGLPWGAGR